MASNDKISNMTVAVVGDILGSAGRIEMTKAFATAPVTLGLDFATLRTSMFAGSTGYTATDPITAGAASFTTGAFSDNVGVGAASLSHIRLYLTGNVTASASAAFGIYSGATLVASANNNALSGHRIDFAATPGVYTGLVARGLYINGFSTAAFTSPADPAGIQVAVVTGTGATNAYAVLLSPPTGASNNYLIAHTTATTFNVTAAGAITGQGATFTTLTATSTVTFQDGQEMRWPDASNRLFFNGGSFRIDVTGSQRFGIAVTTGAARFYNTLTSDGDFTVGASTFVVTAATGAVATSGALAITGALTGVTTAAASSTVSIYGGTAAPATAGAAAAGAPIKLYSGLLTIEATTDVPTHTRPKGSLCINTGGSSTTTRLYVNTDGAGTWTPFTTSA